jgi:hypothetical protein
MWGVINLLAERHHGLTVPFNNSSGVAYLKPRPRGPTPGFLALLEVATKRQVRRGIASPSLRLYLSATASALVVGAAGADMKSSRQPCEQK